MGVFFFVPPIEPAFTTDFKTLGGFFFKLTDFPFVLEIGFRAAFALITALDRIFAFAFTTALDIMAALAFTLTFAFGLSFAFDFTIMIHILS